jgi:hypothetical protein
MKNTINAALPQHSPDGHGSFALQLGGEQQKIRPIVRLPKLLGISSNDGHHGTTSYRASRTAMQTDGTGKQVCY